MGFILNPYRFGGPTSTLNTGIVAFWKLDEASGPRNDSVGTSHLADNNTVTQVAGYLGNAAQFTAANNEHLSIADNASFGFTNAVSFSFWIKQTDVTAGNQTVIGKWTYATDGEFAIQSHSSPGQFRIFLATSANDGGGGCLVDTANAFQLSAVWYHIVVVYDGSLTGNANRLKVYQDSTLLDMTQGSGNVPSSLVSGTAPFYLGRFGGSLDRYWDGAMQLVGMWNRALTAAEVLDLFNPSTSVTAVTAQGLGTLRNNYNGCVGVGITPQKAFIPTHIGRWKIAGNSGVHALKIIRAGDGVVVASASVDMSTGSTGDYVYAATTMGVNGGMMYAGYPYAVLSEETNGGDQWYDADTTLTVSSIFSSPISGFNSSVCSGNFVSITADRIYGPVNFKGYYGQAKGVPF